MALFTIAQEIDHHIADRRCPACWGEYPERCKCGGLMHAAMDGEDADGQPLCVTKCDRCGRSEEDLAAA